MRPARRTSISLSGCRRRCHTTITATAAADTSAAAMGAAQELKWEELVPKNWDPTKRYRNLSLEALRDNDPRAIQMLDEMRAVWDNAPTVHAMNGRNVRLPGYVVPLEATAGALKEFLLVPYFGACIHTPPPPANQIVHVTTEKPVTGFGAMAAVW